MTWLVIYIKSIYISEKLVWNADIYWSWISINLKFSIIIRKKHGQLMYRVVIEFMSIGPPPIQFLICVVFDNYKRCVFPFKERADYDCNYPLPKKFKTHKCGINWHYDKYKITETGSMVDRQNVFYQRFICLIAVLSFSF